jgi:hypothetical protein
MYAAITNEETQQVIAAVGRAIAECRP